MYFLFQFVCDREFYDIIEDLVLSGDCSKLKKGPRRLTRTLIKILEAIPFFFFFFRFISEYVNSSLVLPT